jgi:hypothetical protein
MEDVMPRFFLHVRDGEKLFKDGEGQEFPSLAEARTEAVLSARELMAALMVAGRQPDQSRLEVADDSGAVMLVMPFEDALAEAD